MAVLWGWYAVNSENLKPAKDGDPEARLPQYTSQKIRYALVISETKDHKAVGINYIDDGYLVFHSDSSPDVDYREQATKLALEIVPPIESDARSDPVINAGHNFAKNTMITSSNGGLHLR